MRRLREGDLQMRFQLQENELKHVNLGIFAMNVYNIITKRCLVSEQGGGLTPSQRSHKMLWVNQKSPVLSPSTQQGISQKKYIKF